MKKKLYVDKSQGLILGVCAGIAKYFSMDVTLVRVICVIIIAISGLIPGMLGYIIAALIMPESKKGS
ncbi:MAG: PspC domain-containing protein [bacterium]